MFSNNNFKDMIAKAQKQADARRQAHAEERIKRGLSPVGNGKAGEEVEFFDTTAWVEAKPGQEWRVLNALPLGASRFGWLPDLPAGLAWPSLDGRKLLFLAQINLADLPRSNDGLLPRNGWLYVFGRCDNDHRPHAIKILFASGAAEELIRAERPEDAELWPDWSGNVVYDGVPITVARRDVSKSDGRSGVQPSGWMFHSSDEFGAPPDMADRAFLEGTDWINLITIRSVGGMEWSDCGELYINVRRGDLQKMDFTSVCAEIGSS